MSKLFSEVALRSLTSRNRIMVSPMCQYSSEDGFATNWHLVHLGSRAVGGAGIVMSEATAVSPEGRISYADLGIWKDEHLPKLKQITEFVKDQGAIPAIQLAHAGRKASKNKPWEGNEYITPEKEGWDIVAPSAIPFKEDAPVPKEMEKHDIEKVIEDFVAAAKRALKAGFEIAEIHAAHGYLLHEFCSPVSNDRSDKYGGSFENRIRLVLEVTEAVREVWPAELPLFVRISATDWLPERESWTIEDSVNLSKELKKRGVDLIDVSSGGLVPEQKVDGGPGFQMPFAEQIKREAEIATGAVGIITQAQQAETILRTEQADLIIMAREFLRDPYFPLHAADNLRDNIEWPNQYKRAKP
ncbi:NADPH dehydrogenase NamA [Gracilimonas mengyeensis]|uniref:2,4-dienoyl-CoA reductase n=1 Tax=Gracilimonas mengyeensis TaxID=1302730 RepID=A0A521E461_9BACT|nr:NADPH dehydrogenase NamA [Gracilimonas mengyeensis]SMO78726.1 2,4-dienoyl-CoA reductase [Gracilimonas mengyeensis]